MAKAQDGHFIWHELWTNDVTQALAFYSHVLGWAHETSPMGGGSDYHVLQAGGRGMGGMLELSKAQCDAGMRAGWVGYISSSDVDAHVARLKQAGGTVHRAAMDIPNIGRLAPVSDPQGAGFILFTPQPPPGGAPPVATGVGTVGWNELCSTDWKAGFAFYSEMFGWTKGDSVDMGPMGTYQLFAAGAEAIGGMMSRPHPAAPVQWLYYFNVESIEAAVARVKEKGGAVTHGPMEVPGSMWTVQCRDVEGASFALVSTRR